MNVEGSFVTTNEVEFMLFDMNGITILNKKIPANGGKLHSRIDLNDVASGVYFYELKTNSGKYKMGKLVIQ